MFGRTATFGGYNVYVNSGQIALLVDLLRYVSLYGAGRTGAASRPPPCTRLWPAKSPLRGTFDLSRRLRVGPRQRPCKHGPQPASMRAAPTFRGTSRANFEAASIGSFSNNGRE